MGTPAVATPNAPRVIQNPIIGDKVTFLATARETGGASTIVEVELHAGGGNGLHYHTTFDETFTALEGRLSLEVDGKKLCLKPGEEATAPIGSRHRFFNETDQTIRFRVSLSPGSEGFENVLRIAYGLATDGRCNPKSGVPKNLYHLAVVVMLGETRLVGPLSLLQPTFRWLHRRARRKGIEQELLDRYCYDKK